MDFYPDVCFSKVGSGSEVVFSGEYGFFIYNILQLIFKLFKSSQAGLGADQVQGLLCRGLQEVLGTHPGESANSQSTCYRSKIFRYHLSMLQACPKTICVLDRFNV